MLQARARNVGAWIHRNGLGIQYVGFCPVVFECHFRRVVVLIRNYDTKYSYMIGTIWNGHTRLQEIVGRSCPARGRSTLKIKGLRPAPSTSGSGCVIQTSGGWLWWGAGEGGAGVWRGSGPRMYVTVSKLAKPTSGHTEP